MTSFSPSRTGWRRGLSGSVPFVLALALAISATWRFGPAVLRVPSPLWGVLVLLALLLFVPVRKLVWDVLVPRLRTYSPWERRAWLLGMLAAAVLLILVTPLKPPPMPGAGEVTFEWLSSSVSPTMARVYRRVMRTADVLSIGFLLLLAGLWLASWEGSRREREPLRWGWLGASALCAAIWSIYALAFWPGLMTVDSMVQWGQMVTGRLSNGHPAFHTMLNWLLTRAWYSPAAVSLFQILALSLVFGLVVRELSLWRVPRWLLGLVTVLFALSPVNGTLVITLWKDVAYTIVHVALFGVLLRLTRTRGESLRSTPFLLGLSGALVLIALLRHNGAVVAAMMAVGLIFVVPRPLRRRALVMALATAAGFLLVTRPFYSLLGVQPVSGPFLYSIQVHQMGAMVRSAPDSFSPEDRQLLESIQPWEVWRDHYHCYAVNPLIYGKRIRADFFDSPARHDFVRMWLRLIPSHWKALLDHQACVSYMIWMIRPVPDRPIYLFTLDMDPNGFGLKQEPKLPAARALLKKWLDEMERQPDLKWWLWRPALYLYLCLFFTVIAVARLRSAWGWVPTLPVLLNTLGLLALSVAPDFRYQYPVYAVSLVSLGLLGVPRGARAEEAGSGTAATP